jgi:hypothetical protein
MLSSPTRTKLVGFCSFSFGNPLTQGCNYYISYQDTSQFETRKMNGTRVKPLEYI